MKKIKILSALSFFVLYNVNVYAQPCWCSFLNNFSATQQSNKQMKIHWETDTESSTAKDFIIQRSFNGFSTSTDIGYVSGHPNESHSYDFYDAYPCNGSNTTVYYRLKGVNIDNNIRTSGTISVSLSGCPSCANPTTCQCNLNTLIGADAFCSSSDYEVTNASGAVTWTISPSGIVNVSNLTSTKINLSKITDGAITLTAALTNCTSLTKTIIVGAPGPTTINMDFQSSCIGGSDWDAEFSPSPLILGLTYLWSINGSSYASGLPYYNEHYDVGESSDPSITLNIKYQSSCGTSSAMTFPATYYSPCGGHRIKISPNPVKDLANLTIETDGTDNMHKLLTTPFKATISIYNQNNILVKRFTTTDKNITLTRYGILPGRYIIQVIIGTEKISQQLIFE
jgi:hypothetical protein